MSVRPKIRLGGRMSNDGFEQTRAVADLSRELDRIPLTRLLHSLRAFSPGIQAAVTAVFGYRNMTLAGAADRCVRHFDENEQRLAQPEAVADRPR